MPDKNNHSIDERDLVFRYSRERRLENASETVKKLNEEGARKYSFNLLRPLTSTKPLAFLFVSILVLTAMMYIFSFLFGGKKEVVLGGNTLTVSAFTFEGKTYLTLDKEIKNKNNFYTGSVDLAISSDDETEEPAEELEIHNERIFFTSDAEENFKMAIPFEADKLLILVQSEREIQELRVTTE
jgi:hypothetical protein